MRTLWARYSLSICYPIFNIMNHSSSFMVVQERSFRLACEEGDLEIVRVFLAHGGFDINAQNKASLLYWLCRCWVFSHISLLFFLCIIGWRYRVDICCQSKLGFHSYRTVIAPRYRCEQARLGKLYICFFTSV